MNVTVELYSKLRDLAPELNQSVVELPDGATVGDLLSHLYARNPALREWDAQLGVAVALEWQPRDRVLADGETVALMPPVQGG